MPKLVEKDTNIQSSEDSMATGSDSDDDDDDDDEDSQAGFVSASQYDPGPVRSPLPCCAKASLTDRLPKW